MSANTYWRPVKPGKSINCVSSLLTTIADAKDSFFEGGELFLNVSDIPFLKGIAAADKSSSKPIQEIINALEEYNTIALWHEY